ncbi:MAG: Arsenical pump membrane protein [Chlamydiia bacterium]|nr:Arsenical pump membrane protein [Chlamydiia bacterium]
MIPSILSVLIFCLTITLVIVRPKKLNIGTSALVGAVLVFVFNLVSVHDLYEVVKIVWNALATFIGIIVISLVLDEIGFFEWAALFIISASRKSVSRLFFLVILLGALVAICFSNDGSALILTPVILAKIKLLKLPREKALPFVMAGGFIADTASVPFIISNLVNIISADFVDMGFIKYALLMILPSLAAIGMSFLMLYLVYQKQLKNQFFEERLTPPMHAVRSKSMFILAWVVIGLMLLGCFVSGTKEFPVSFIVIPCAAILFIVAQYKGIVRPLAIMKNTPFSIIFFSIGMFVTVYGLKNGNITILLAHVMEMAYSFGEYASTLIVGALAAALSCIMNNLPAVMVNMIAVEQLDLAKATKELFTMANVIGADIGPKMIPIGSLSTLIWLHILEKRDFKITWGYYMRVGVVLTIPTLFVALSSLYVWHRILT